MGIGLCWEAALEALLMDVAMWEGTREELGHLFGMEGSTVD